MPQDSRIHWQIRADRDLNGYSFSGSLRYDILKDTSLKAAFMRNINFPTMSELYLRPELTPACCPRRLSITSSAWSRSCPGQAFSRINGFYKTIHNFIGLQQEQLSPQVGFQPYNINFPLIRFYGFESSMETSFVKQLTLKLAYTLDESYDLSGPTFIDDKNQLQYVPKNKVTFTGKYDFDCGLTPFLSVVYVGDSVVYSKQEYVTVPRYAYMTPYVVANVKISQKLFKDRLTVYVGADNILNRNYEDTYGIPRPGRYVLRRL